MDRVEARLERIQPTDPGRAALVHDLLSGRTSDAGRRALDDLLADPHVRALPAVSQPGAFGDEAQAVLLNALDRLEARGWVLAVCTNKPVAAARLILEHLGLAPLVDALAGGDSFPVRKPDPGHLLGTLRLMGVTAEGSAPPGVVMVGDHANDIRSARGAGAAPVFAAWGYGLPEMADGAPVAASPADLPALLARIGGRD